MRPRYRPRPSRKPRLPLEARRRCTCRNGGADSRGARISARDQRVRRRAGDGRHTDEAGRGAPTSAGKHAAAAMARTRCSAVPATGRLEIETQPGGASIVLDGKPVGESPLALDAVPWDVIA